MALDFCVISLKPMNRGYIARVRFKGVEDDYRILTNGLMFYNGLSTEYGFMICDFNSKIPDNGEAEEMFIRVEGKDQRKAIALEKALKKFILNQ